MGAATAPPYSFRPPKATAPPPTNTGEAKSVSPKGAAPPKKNLKGFESDRGGRDHLEKTAAPEETATGAVARKKEEKVNPEVVNPPVHQTLGFGSPAMGTILPRGLHGRPALRARGSPFTLGLMWLRLVI